MLRLLLLFLSLFSYSYSEICTPSENTYYINDNIQLESIKNCSKINGNLVIIGEYEIDYLHLTKLENITGYVVIMDSHTLHSLKGLHNLKYIGGDDLYLDEYSLVIKNNLAEDNIGLCYVDTINWNVITNHSIHIENNNDNCPKCDPNCLGCWDHGPRNCQFCKNFTSGITCVETCPEGTQVDNKICIESPPSNINLIVNDISINKITTSWDFTDGTNGVILGCDVYRNDTIVSSEYITNDNILNYTYIDNGLDENTYYQYRVYCYNNNNGSYSNYLNIKTKNLDNIKNLTLQSRTSNSISLSWNQEYVDYYKYMLHGNEILEGQINDNYIVIEDLTPFTNYKFMVSGCIEHHCGNYTNLNISTLESYPSIPRNISFNCIYTPESDLGNEDQCHQYYTEGDCLLDFDDHCSWENGECTHHEDTCIWFLSNTECNQADPTYHCEWDSVNNICGHHEDEHHEDEHHEGSKGISSILSWTAPKFPNGILQNYQYNLYRDDFIENGTTENTEILLTNLDFYTEYTIQISASTNKGYGNYSSFSFISCEGIPETPEISWNVIYENDDVHLNFNWSEYGINGELLYYKYNATNDKGFTISNITLNNFVELPMNYFTNYNISLLTCNTEYCGNVSNLSILTNPGIPPKPKVPNIVSVNLTHINILIEPVSDINGTVSYDIIYHSINQYNETVQINSMFIGNYKKDITIPINHNYNYKIKLVANTTKDLNSSSDFTSTINPLSISTTTAPSINPTNHGEDNQNIGEIIMWIFIGIIILIILITIGYVINKMTKDQGNLSNLEGRYKNRNYGPNCAESIVSYTNPIYSPHNPRPTSNPIYTLEEDMIDDGLRYSDNY